MKRTLVVDANMFDGRRIIVHQVLFWRPWVPTEYHVHIDGEPLRITNHPAVAMRMLGHALHVSSMKYTWLLDHPPVER